ncbi:hypothetical protein [Sphingomonas phage Birtae]|nr:hypothetical protein [Sphingomonas phage Birtae]
MTRTLEEERLKTALKDEASMLRSTGFPDRAAALDAAAEAITLASAQRILAGLRQ